METVELSNLVGRHVLTAVEQGSYYTEGLFAADADSIAFTLDGVTYLVQEDPEDGYRSYAKDVVVIDRQLDVQIPPTPVTISYDSGDKHDKNDIINFYADNGALILKVGTEHTDDYYPCYVAEWIPENLPSNDGK